MYFVPLCMIFVVNSYYLIGRVPIPTYVPFFCIPTNYFVDMMCHVIMVGLFRQGCVMGMFCLHQKFQNVLAYIIMITQLSSVRSWYISYVFSMLRIVSCGPRPYPVDIHIIILFSYKALNMIDMLMHWLFIPSFILYFSFWYWNYRTQLGNTHSFQWND